MVQEADYTRLHERLNKANQNRARLLEREETAKGERDRLVKELEAKGIDVSKPDEEIARLEAEIQADYQRQEQTIAQFEQNLQTAMAGAQPVAIASASDLDL
jgi:chromosome segregation ATPase